MNDFGRVAIVGVGLIGGSIGLALRRRDLAREVVGIGRSPASLRIARQVGAVTRTTVDLDRGVSRADLVVVCTPVELIVPQVRQIAAVCPEGALVTDAGSTKADIVRGLDGSLKRNVRFVGSHPLAGSEKSGPGVACEDLYDGRVVVVTPTEQTSAADLRRISEFWQALGAQVIMRSPEEHDRALAGTSHLPHLVASVLSAATPEEDLPMTASGWQDTTRVAAGDVELWTQIFATNRQQVLAALDRYETVLAEFRAALERPDRRKLKRILTEGKQKRDAVGN